MANKQELVDSVAKATGLTKKDATAAVDAVFYINRRSFEER